MNNFTENFNIMQHKFSNFVNFLSLLYKYI